MFGDKLHLGGLMTESNVRPGNDGLALALGGGNKWIRVWQGGSKSIKTSIKPMSVSSPPVESIA